MTIEDHMDKFLDIFEKFEKCIEKRPIPIQIADRRNRIALFGIYMITHQEGE